MRILIDGDATPDIEKIAFLCDKYDPVFDSWVYKKGRKVPV